MTLALCNELFKLSRFFDRFKSKEINMKPIITHLTDVDFYKFTIGQYIYHKHPSDTAKWAFKCRNANVKFTPEMIAEIKRQLDYFCTLKFTQEELDYLSTIKFIKRDYIDNYLRHWQPDRSEIHVNEIGMQAYNDCGLAIECEGTWLNTSFYEIAILTIVNEVYFAYKFGEGAKDIEFQEKTIEKFNKALNGEYKLGVWSEFGTRRRYSYDMQDWLIKYIVDKKIPGFVGTSNVWLAQKYGVKATGTLAHECIMAQQGRPEFAPAWSNKFVMEEWLDEYGVLPGVFLGDTIGTNVFLKDFTLKYAHSFNGVRHDSSDPFEWGEKLIAHYNRLGINPKTKTLLFSDSLDFKRATALYDHFNDRAHVAFGIGTYLSGVQHNDEVCHPLNIVCKMTECNGLPVAKLSDTPSKSMCRDNDYVDYLKRCIEWRLKYER